MRGGKRRKVGRARKCNDGGGAIALSSGFLCFNVGHYLWILLIELMWL
jgi:hypothetical protein